jgi:hypothetical protein
VRKLGMVVKDPAYSGELPSIEKQPGTQARVRIRGTHHCVLQHEGAF